MTADPFMYRNQYRGCAQPQQDLSRHETREETRRRLHREAAQDVKHYAAALREAKARYRDYDATMAEDAAEEAGGPEVPRAITQDKGQAE